MAPLILASASPTRQAMLEAAGLEVVVSPARLDEAAVIAAMAAEGAAPREVADALAEAKARKVANRHPGGRVLGADQVLVHDGSVLTKPADRDGAAAQLGRLQGARHELLSAACLVEDGRPIWRHVSRARLAMRVLDADAIEAHLRRTWPDVAGAVGAYHIEGQGLRLFRAVDGDVWTIRGLPLLELLSFLIDRGTLRP